MDLIGQFDSPFVRRVGIALEWYQLPFTQRPLSVFGDSERLATFNPLRRVPTLVLDNGTTVIDSFVCLEYIDELAAEIHGSDWTRLLAPRSGPERLRVLRLCGLACGAADKVVSLVYEERIREDRSLRWTARCTAQLKDTLTWLEREYADNAAARRPLTHAEIALTCLLTFIGDAQPWLLELVAVPHLLTVREQCEQLPEFKRVFAPFTVRTGND